jgi:hypothetical protein
MHNELFGVLYLKYPGTFKRQQLFYMIEDINKNAIINVGPLAAF